MTKHIGLIGNQSSNAYKNHSHLDEHRPDKLNLNTSKSILNPKWAECKVVGKNILIRSYAATCIHDNNLFVYGGLQILEGILSDFHMINLDPSNSKFQWVDVPLKPNSITPGPHAKHTMVCYKHKIYIVGGIKSAAESDNDLYCYDIKSEQWHIIKPQGQSMPYIDSFGGVLVGSHIIMICGYNSKLGEFLNSVYDYDIETNTVNCLFLDSETNKSKKPLPRANCSAATDGIDTLYIFGGNYSDHRLNDLWSFNIKTKKYIQAGDKEQLRPVVRSGHTVTFYHNKLYIFGGIHEVTWELDDLHIYDLKTHYWTTLEIDSARRKNANMSPSRLLDSKKEVSPGRKKQEKYWMETVISNISHNKSGINASVNQKKKSNLVHLEEQHEVHGSSPGKMIDEQRRKEFKHKKAEMLKEFNVSEKEKNRYISVEPTTQAIRNSLDIIGNPNPRLKHPGKLTQFGKESSSKFLEPLSNNVNLIVGKKPCARDGHNTVIMGESLIIFGGDRHQMSFNDIYRLDMKLVTNQFHQ